MCAEDAAMLEHVNSEYGGVERVRKIILRDYFRHGFDGSGDDGGSCETLVVVVVFLISCFFQVWTGG